MSTSTTQNVFQEMEENIPLPNGPAILRIPTAGFVGTEFVVMRCDYMLASQALAQHATSYQIIRDSLTDMASDHYPILATFEVPR